MLCIPLAQYRESLSCYFRAFPVHSSAYPWYVLEFEQCIAFRDALWYVCEQEVFPAFSPDLSIIGLTNPSVVFGDTVLLLL